MDALMTNIINNLIHGLWFYSLVLEPKHNRKKTLEILAAAVTISQLVMLFLFGWMHHPALFFRGTVSAKKLYLCGYCLTAFIFGTVFVFLLSASSLAKSLFLMSAYYNFWALVYLTVSLITDTSAGAGNPVIWGMRIGLNLSVLALYDRLFKSKIRQMYKSIQIGYTTVAGVSFFTLIVMTIVIIYQERMKPHDLLYTVMVFCTGAMIVVIHMLLFQFIAKAGCANQLKQMQLHEKYLREQIDSYEQMEQNARQTRHDFRHHNMVVAEFARQKDYQAILTYLHEYETQEADKYRSAFCKNHVVNNVLCAYVSRAQRENIEVSSDICLGETTEISDYDLVSILANVLENAVNACGRETGERRLDISLWQKASKLIFICKNTCTMDVKFKKGIPRGQERVGVGIGSVRSCADKYDGSVNFSVEDGVFTSRVILNNVERKNRRGGGKMLC